MNLKGKACPLRRQRTGRGKRAVPRTVKQRKNSIIGYAFSKVPLLLYAIRRPKNGMLGVSTTALPGSPCHRPLLHGYGSPYHEKAF